MAKINPIKKATISFRLASEEKKKLQSLCQAKGYTMSSVISYGIKMAISYLGKKKSAVQPL
jgi:hypothetical protein